MFNGYDSMLMCKSGRPDNDGFQQSKFKIKNLDEMEETLYMLKASFSSLKRSKNEIAHIDLLEHHLQRNLGRVKSTF